MAGSETGKTGRFVKGQSGNPKGRPRKNRTDAGRQDSHWRNRVTGLGTGRDKSTFGSLYLSVVSDGEARDLWRGSDLAAKIVESAPCDALRGGFCLKLEDKKQSELIHAALEGMQCPTYVGHGALAMLRKAREYRCAYGGAAIFPVINDAAGSLAEPLLETGIGKIERLMLFEPRELQPLRYYTDPNHPKFGEVELWQLNPINVGRVSIGYVQIHETRLIIVQGKRVTAEESSGTREGWGDNVFTSILDSINKYEQGLGASSALLQDFSQAVIKMKNMTTSTGIGPSVVDRIEMMNLMRSSLRAVLLDSEDSFTREATPTAGLPDILDRLMYRVAAASEMPVTKLFGMAPGGLNATGESDAKNWDRIVGIEQTDMTPQIEQLVRFVMLSKEGPTKGKEPSTWSVEWYPLSQPSAKEKADTNLVIAQTDQINIETGLYTAQEAAESHYRGDTYSADIVVDWETREAQDKTESDFTTESAEGAPEGEAGAPAGESVQQTAFNGAQVSSMIEVVKAAIAKEIPRESAAMILEIAFPITKAQATALLGPENFEAKPAVPAAPFGAKPPGGSPDQTPPDSPSAGEQTPVKPDGSEGD